MEGDVAATIAFEKFNTALGQEFRRCNHVCSFRVAAESDDGRVFKQQKNISALFFFALVDELLLQPQASCVLDGAESRARNQTLAATDFHRSTRINRTA